MRIECAHRPSANAQAEFVDKVEGDGAEHGAEVEFTLLAGRTRLDIIFSYCLDDKQRNAHRLVLRQLLHEISYAGLLLCQFYGAVLIPEFIVAVAGVGDLFGLGLTAEERVGQFVEGIVRDIRVPHCQELQLGQLQFCPHVVRRQSPFAVIKLCKHLVDVEVVNKVHITLFGNRQTAFLHVECGVREHIEVSAESEVLRVVGPELQMIALLAVDHDRILNIIAVETDSCGTNGADEGELQQAHIVFVDIDVLKHFLKGRIHHITGHEQLVHSAAVLPVNDVFLSPWILAEHMLLHGFIHHQRHDYLVVIGAYLCAFIPVELLGADAVAVSDSGFIVVECQRYLLVLGVLIVVVVLEVGAFFRLHHPAHEIYSGIILPAIAFLLSLNHDLRHL